MSTNLDTASDPLAATLAAIRERLRENHYFDDIPIILDTDDGIMEKMNNALAGLIGRSGAAGAVLALGVAELRDNTPNVAGPMFDNVTVEATARENPILNREVGGTRKTARAIALETARTLHHWKCGTAMKTLVVTGVANVDDPEGMIAFTVSIATGGIRLEPWQPDYFR